MGKYYSPERDITPAFLAVVRRWIEEAGEVLTLQRYLWGAGRIDFALIASIEGFDRLVEVCPEGTEIIVFRGTQLPLRGRIDAAFAAQVVEALSKDSEFIIVNVCPENSSDPRLWGETDFIHSLEDSLNNLYGESVAVGVCPNYLHDHPDSVISAAKGGIDGAR